MLTDKKDITKEKQQSADFATQIIFILFFGAIFGLVLRICPTDWNVNKYIVDGALNIGGTIFINSIKMLVVPLVLVSLLCGICSLDDIGKLGRISVKTFVLVVFTTVLAVVTALLFANFLHVGHGMHLPAVEIITIQKTPSLLQFFLNIVPSNVMVSLVNADILQIIIVTILFGFALNLSGEPGKRIISFFQDLNVIISKMVMIVMRLMPLGVFCLVAILFAKSGYSVILQLLNYFVVVILVLFFHTFITLSILLRSLGKLKVASFFKKMKDVMLFAFSISSSNASLPLALETVEKKLGVDKSIAALVLPLGTNINKNGTAIMQGVAAIFIANSYNIGLTFMDNLMIVVTTVLASISTAGIPSVGIFALAIVLKQVGLPLEGIALILTVDRFLDMIRTAVNVASNAVIACLVGKSEDKMDTNVYYE